MKRSPMPKRKAALPRGPGPARKPLPAGKPPKRHAKIAARNRVRKAAEFARCFGSEDRAAFVQSLPCCVPGCGFVPSQNAHVGGLAQGAGMGRKSDASAVAPICYRHHPRQEGRTAAFEREIGVEPGFFLKVAAAVDRTWQAMHPSDS